MRKSVFSQKLHFYTSCIFCVFISAVQKVQVRMTILHLLLIFTKIEDFALKKITISRAAAAISGAAGGGSPAGGKYSGRSRLPIGSSQPHHLCKPVILTKESIQSVFSWVLILRWKCVQQGNQNAGLAKTAHIVLHGE